jgi:hypothetical protein
VIGSCPVAWRCRFVESPDSRAPSEALTPASGCGHEDFLNNAPNTRRQRYLVHVSPAEGRVRKTGKTREIDILQADWQRCLRRKPSIVASGVRAYAPARARLPVPVEPLQPGPGGS